MVWNEAADNIVCELWRKGFTALHIAHELKRELGLTTTRSGVLGRVHRKHLTRPITKYPSVKLSHTVVPRKRRLTTGAIMPSLTEQPLPEGVEAAFQVDPDTDTSQRCSIMELSSRRCCWPYD